MIAQMEHVLLYAVVPEMPGMYVCGCFERWVSIYLQAVRGLNLAWALVESGRAGARVAVVGGGFAGLSAAAGLGRKGVSVTLFERNPQLLHTQRNNRVRSIHPHIHEWPRPGALEPRAGLPLLDWTAGISADMAGEVLRQFDAEVLRSHIVVRPGSREPDLAGFDAVILALGVGVEKSFGKLPLRSYWSDDTIAQVRPGLRHHLVTGIGEGGVIDALYLRLRDFSHGEIAARLAEIEGMAAVESALLEIEHHIEKLDDLEANRVLSDGYARLPVPARVDELLRQRARPDTRVTLNGPEVHPLAARADMLNRFLISRLVALGELDYLSGKISDISEDFEVTLDSGERRKFDDVEIRHGTVPALKAGFPEVWERYYPTRVKLPHLTPQPSWPDGYFTSSSPE
jgi:glycine/D-amino acid oxidase-like deaminating enzyme